MKVRLRHQGNGDCTNAPERESWEAWIHKIFTAYLEWSPMLRLDCLGCSYNPSSVALEEDSTQMLMRIVWGED